MLAFFTICPFYHCSQILFPCSWPTSAWGRSVELLSKPRKTVRKLYHEHVVSPRRCFSIGKSMKRWKKSIGNELRRRLWSNASWMRRWERYSKITDCWYLVCWGNTEVKYECLNSSHEIQWFVLFWCYSTYFFCCLIFYLHNYSNVSKRWLKNPFKLHKFFLIEWNWGRNQRSCACLTDRHSSVLVRANIL